MVHSIAFLRAVFISLCREYEL